MAGLNKEELARAQGIAFALRIAEKDGIEALREEAKKRNITGVSLNISHKELEKATINMRNMMFDTFLCFTVGILHDCYGFGEKRAREFVEHFNEGAKFIEDGVLSWQQVIENTEEALGMKLHMRENLKDTRLERMY